jgi:hypothetical protein
MVDRQVGANSGSGLENPCRPKFLRRPAKVREGLGYPEKHDIEIRMLNRGFPVFIKADFRCLPNV